MCQTGMKVERPREEEGWEAGCETSWGDRGGSCLFPGLLLVESQGVMICWLWAWLDWKASRKLAKPSSGCFCEGVPREDGMWDSKLRGSPTLNVYDIMHGAGAWRNKNRRRRKPTSAWKFNWCWAGACITDAIAHGYNTLASSTFQFRLTPETLQEASKAFSLGLGLHHWSLLFWGF